MRYVVTPEMRRAFVDTGLLTLEDFLTKRQVDELNLAIDGQMDGLKVPKPHSFIKRYAIGRDLWRRDERIKRVVLNPMHADFVKDLLKVREVILGFDQLFDYIIDPSPYKDPESPSDEPSTLEEIFSVSPLGVGLKLQLKGDGAGSALLIGPGVVIDWEKEKIRGNRFLLVGYAQEGAVYKENPKDIATHFLKQFDLRDRHPLKEPLHPVF